MIFILQSEFILMSIFCAVEIFWYQTFMNPRILPMKLEMLVNLQNAV